MRGIPSLLVEPDYAINCFVVEYIKSDNTLTVPRRWYLKLHRIAFIVLLCSTQIVLATSLTFAKTITSFENASEVAVFSPSGLHARQSVEHATDGTHSLQVEVKGSEIDSWPGLRYVPTNPDLSAYAIIAYDVFLKGETPVTIKWRIEDATGREIFLSSTTNPCKNKVELWLRRNMYEIDFRQIKSIYAYFSNPKSDSILYFDNFRFETTATRFKPMVFEETNPLLGPSAQDKERGYTLFGRPWLATVFPDSLPLSNELNPQLDSFGTPGQTVSVTFCIRSLQDLGDTSVSVSDLTSGKSSLSAGKVAVYPVSYRDKRRNFSSDYFVKDMPTFLEQRSSVKVAANRTQTFWLNVNIPATTAPGVYSGQVSVTTSLGKSSSTLPLRIRVLPYKLSEPDNMLWGEYYRKPELFKTMDEKRASIKHDLADQRHHGMTSVGLTFGLERNEYQVEGTEVRISPEPNGLYETFMKAYKRLSFPLPVIQLADDGQVAAGNHPLGSPEWTKIYKNFWIAIAAYHKTHGWPQIIVQPMDEPEWKGPDERSRNILCLSTLKQIPGQRTEQNGPGNDYFLYEAGPFADVWNLNGSMKEESIIRQARETGHIITTYNNDVESYRPEAGRYFNGFYQLSAGTNGTYNWAYNGIVGNPYDDQATSSGNAVHFYPPMPDLGEVGGSSTGWEGARAGIDDFKYAHTLRLAIARASKSKSNRAQRAATAGAAALASVLSSIEFRPIAGRSESFIAEMPRADGSKRFLGALKVPNGWDLDAYDRARWLLSTATMNILTSQDEIRSAPKLNPLSGVDLLRNVRWTESQVDRLGADNAIRNHLTIPFVAGKPVFDGELNDDVWQKAAKIDEFKLLNGEGKLNQQTHVWLYTDSKTLFFAVECLEKDIANIIASVDRDGGTIGNDDNLAIFIDPTLSRKRFFQIDINALGKISLTHPTDMDWKPNLQRAAAIDKAGKRWTVEMAIPLESMGPNKDVFGFNIARGRRVQECLELSSWWPTGPRPDVPEHFGVVSIGNRFLSSFKLGRGVLGTNEAVATVRNMDPTRHKFLVTLTWRQGEEKTLRRRQSVVELQPGQSQDVRLAYELESERDSAAIALAIQDAATGTLYAERQTNQAVHPVLTMRFSPRIAYLAEQYGQLQADINLSSSLQNTSVLMITLFDSTGNSIRTQTLPVNNGRLNVAVNMSGLQTGTYRLEGALTSSKGTTVRRLSTANTTITKLAGPFE